MSSQTISNLIKVASCVLLMALIAGCASTSGPASASFASVTIHNHSAEEIQATAAQVFREAGYSAAITGMGQLVFEKEASRWTTMSREGVMATQEGARTIERVRANLVDLGGNSYRLQCQAYMVSGGSDPFFQDEVAVTHVRSGPYRSLLNKVASQLK